MDIEPIIELFGQVEDAYKTLQAISPNHELLKYVSLDEGMVARFLGVEASKEFTERFGPGINIFSWGGSFEEYGNHLASITFGNYLGSLERAIGDFVN